MGFSGKPSKGCAPCRAKRTKCDLAQPFCTQCVRKNRICSGYRDAQDMIFVNETMLVVRKAKRRAEDLPRPSVSVDHSIRDMLQKQQPSRRASLDNEAMMHFFSNYNKKFFPRNSQSHGDDGLDYMLPLYQKDSITGGPVSEIIRASGLAALGNRGNPKLLIEARAKQVKVLGQLNKLLQDPKTAYSESTLLTCVLLGAFENIIWDSPRSMEIRTAHVQGAVTLVELIGPKRLSSTVGRGIYLRVRENMLSHCFLAHEPFPAFLLDDDTTEDPDCDPVLWKLFSRLCQVRADHKKKGLVDAEIAIEAQSIEEDFEKWEKGITKWNVLEKTMADWKINDPHHYIWIWTLWMLHQTSRILALDLVIIWARSQVALEPSTSATAFLADRISTHVVLCENLKKRTDLQLGEFRSMDAGIGTIASYDCLWPLYVLMTSSSCTPETRTWIVQSADMVADEFGVKQAKILADSLRPYI
ncbi:hypothetical protein K504DRAFT_84295 [Pleomassaria siparia CBS 279.74]|uniref:Zn(2)-C6 fungal-type domain-containing protein n=1 Tax=Pleomassaria siparia CBS 279.74 TaxID=1314801 RepID=A0A6G1K014_9PLEO|nr:hypothetical protein K504DRAFT_84295 [Pleomassaria siparia CBS 279.74]